MSAVVPTSGFQERYAQLLEQRKHLDGQIAEVEFWLELCARAEAAPTVEEPAPKKKQK